MRVCPCPCALNTRPAQYARMPLARAPDLTGATPESKQHGVLCSRKPRRSGIQLQGRRHWPRAGSSLHIDLMQPAPHRRARRMACRPPKTCLCTPAAATAARASRAWWCWAAAGAPCPSSSRCRATSRAPRLAPGRAGRSAAHVQAISWWIRALAALKSRLVCAWLACLGICPGRQRACAASLWPPRAAHGCVRCGRASCSGDVRSRPGAPHAAPRRVQGLDRPGDHLAAQLLPVHVRSRLCILRSQYHHFVFGVGRSVCSG